MLYNLLHLKYCHAYVFCMSDGGWWEAGTKNTKTGESTRDPEPTPLTWPAAYDLEPATGLGPSTHDPSRSSRGSWAAGQVISRRSWAAGQVLVYGCWSWILLPAY